MPKGKRHSAQFKFKVALDVAKGAKTLSELASEYGLHPSQISEWKGQLLSAVTDAVQVRADASHALRNPTGLLDLLLTHSL